MFRRQLGEPPHESEQAFDKYGCEEKIKDAVDAMLQFQDKFSYTSLQPFIGRKKQMRRNSVYLRFNCLNCTKGKQKKRFTSTMGTVSIEFQLQEQDAKEKYPHKLVFRFKIYRMECLGCGKYGEGEIYDSQLQLIEKQFCNIIANILNKVPPNRTRNKRPIKVPALANHRHNECQACRLRKCHDGPCPASRQSSSPPHSD